MDIGLDPADVPACTDTIELTADEKTDVFKSLSMVLRAGGFPDADLVDSHTATWAIDVGEMLEAFRSGRRYVLPAFQCGARRWALVYYADPAAPVPTSTTGYCKMFCVHDDSTPANVDKAGIVCELALVSVCRTEGERSRHFSLPLRLSTFGTDFASWRTRQIWFAAVDADSVPLQGVVYVTARLNLRRYPLYAHNQTGRPGIGSLPAEVLSIIHEYAVLHMRTVDMPAMTHRLRSVCKSFRSSMSHKAFSLTSCSGSYDALVEHLRSEPKVGDSIHKLHLHAISADADYNRQLWKSQIMTLALLLPKIDSLECRNTSWDDLGDICEKLGCLTIRNVFWTELEEGACDAILQTWPGLASLEVNHIVSEFDLRPSRLPIRLQRLSTPDAGIDFQEALVQSSARSLTTLTLSLDLFASHPTLQDLVVPLFENLLELRIARKGSGISGQQLGSIISRCTRLRTLDLSRDASTSIIRELLRNWVNNDWTVSTLVVAYDSSQLPSCLVTPLTHYGRRTPLKRIILRRTAPDSDDVPEWGFSSVMAVVEACREANIALLVEGRYGYTQMVYV